VLGHTRLAVRGRLDPQKRRVQLCHSPPEIGPATSFDTVSLHNCTIDHQHSTVRYYTRFSLKDQLGGSAQGRLASHCNDALCVCARVRVWREGDWRLCGMHNGRVSEWVKGGWVVCQRGG
jgi:hypothetical protein